MKADVHTTAFKRLIVDLFGSQSAAGRALGFSDRQVRNWIASGPPPHVEKVLARLRRKEISMRHARRILKTRRERRILGSRQRQP
jgi:hypothetical protein